MAISVAIQQLKQALESNNIEGRKIEKAIRLLQDGKETKQFRTGRTLSPETIAKMKAGTKRYWAEKRKASKKN